MAIKAKSISNERLNEAIGKICDNEEFDVVGLETTGKCIPYIGWYWRDVDFDCSYGVTLGIIPSDVSSPLEPNAGGWAGFMENNKWGYNQFQVKEEQQRNLRQMVEQAVTNPNNKKLQALFDYMRTLMPKGES